MAGMAVLANAFQYWAEVLGIFIYLLTFFFQSYLCSSFADLLIGLFVLLVLDFFFFKFLILF